MRSGLPSWNLCPDFDASILDAGRSPSAQSSTLDGIDNLPTRRVADSRASSGVRRNIECLVRPDITRVRCRLIQRRRIRNALRNIVRASSDVVHKSIHKGSFTNSVSRKGRCDIQLAIADIRVVRGRCRHLELAVPRSMGDIR